MAGLGIGPDEFALFEIEDPVERADRLERQLQPKLQSLGDEIVEGLSRVVGKDLFLHDTKIVRRKKVPPGEVFVAFCENPRMFKGLPYLAIAVTHAHLHARVAVRGDSDRRIGMQQALEREARNLARKGKPFRRIRDFTQWDFEELPEVAPAHSAAFWQELAEGLIPSLPSRSPALEVGVSWPSEEARSLSVGDVLGVFRDLAPLYKLLANSQSADDSGPGGGSQPAGP